MPKRPTLGEAVRLALESWARDVHTAIPGRIESYDAAKQVADVLPVIRDARPDELDDTELFEPPVIPNVPVCWPRGGGYALHFPLAKGDYVILLFQEAATGHWRESGEVSEPGDLTRFGFGYPVAFPGIAPNAGALADAPDGEAVINVPDGKVLRVGGAAADFVALAAKVEAELEKIANAFTTFVPGSGGASFPNAYTGSASVGAQQLKAK